MTIFSKNRIDHVSTIVETMYHGILPKLFRQKFYYRVPTVSNKSSRLCIIFRRNQCLFQPRVSDLLSKGF